MKFIIRLVWLSAFICLFSGAAVFANSPKVHPLEEAFESHMKLKHPDFRIVRTPERFAERFNANIPINMTTSLSDGREGIRALVTLHDGTTGEPTESCYAPCTLHKSQGRPTFATAYKWGFHPLPIWIDDPDVMRAESDYWDGEYDLRLGIDFRRAQMRAKLCDSEFASLPKTDGDAKPCFRTPPMLPQVDFSGFCTVAFDLSETGVTTNARITACSDPIFEWPSLLTVDVWKYHPKIERGVAVPRPNVETKLIYQITDYDGHLLDEKGERVAE